MGEQTNTEGCGWRGGGESIVKLSTVEGKQTGHYLDRVGLVGEQTNTEGCGWGESGRADSGSALLRGSRLDNTLTGWGLWESRRTPEAQSRGAESVSCSVGSRKPLRNDWEVETNRNGDSNKEEGDTIDVDNEERGRKRTRECSRQEEIVTWKEEEDWERGKEDKVRDSGSEESFMEIEVIEIETGSNKEEENDRKMMGRMG